MRVIEASDNMLSLINESINCLPKNVFDYIEEKIGIRCGTSFTYIEDISADGIIFLENELGTRNREFALLMILHQIAHAYLHHRISPNSEMHEDQERKADELARKWLFNDE